MGRVKACCESSELEFGQVADALRQAGGKVVGGSLTALRVGMACAVMLDSQGYAG